VVKNEVNVPVLKNFVEQLYVPTLDAAMKRKHSLVIIILRVLLFAFSALTLLVGRQEDHPASKKLEWWGAGVVICLERGADFHMAQLMPLSLTVSCFSEVQIWFRPTRVVPEKGSLNVCVCACVRACVRARALSSPLYDVYKPL